MTPEHWKRIQRLYNEALNRKPEERHAFLTEACGGNEELLQQVQSLLSAPDSNFLERPAMEVAAASLARDASSSLVGRRLNHYEILSKLGAGGMAEVYRARDTKLNRDAAIKVLPDLFAGDRDRISRFHREAQLLAALNHPHIASIYGLEEDQEISGLALELVEGETLAERISRGAIPVEETIKIARQIAEALGAAHAKGMVHRDLKPANVKITPEGMVKVLDFGLAKIFAPDPSAGLPGFAGDAMTALGTVSGAIVGTIEYMSPEQALGKEVDQRTDIFSLGVVLYEMATGRRPFTGTTPMESVYRIIHSDPPPIESASPSAPPGLEALIRKCLAKEPGNRYQSVVDVLEDLRGLDAPMGHSEWRRTPTPRSMSLRAGARMGSRIAAGVLLIALAAAAINVWWIQRNTPAPGSTSDRKLVRLGVLPFRKLTPLNSSIDNISLALIEDIIVRLAIAAREKIYLPPAASVVRYADVKDRDFARIAGELGVEFILDLSIREAAGNVRINLQLIRPADMNVLWNAQFDRESKRLPELAVNLPDLLDSGLQLRLSPEARTVLQRVDTPNAEAELQYLRGRQSILNRDSSRAREYFERALALDPGFSEAHAGLSTALFSLVNEGKIPASALREAETHAGRAIEINPMNSVAHSVLSDVYGKMRRLPDSYAELRKVLSLEPNRIGSLAELGHFYARRGMRADLAETADRMRKLDTKTAQPLRGDTIRSLAWEGRYEEAEKLIPAPPTSDFARSELAIIRTEQGKFTEAETLIRPIKDPILREMIDLLLQSRMKPGAPLAVNPQMMSFSDVDLIASLWLAFAFGASGRTMEALDRLQTAEKLGFYDTAPLKHSRFFGPIRNHPAFIEHAAGLERRRAALLASEPPVQLPQLGQ